MPSQMTMHDNVYAHNTLKWRLPAGHLTQADEKLAPTTEELVPAGHEMQMRLVLLEVLEA